ncbi:MAG TPA: DUF3160 domain-containing protein [Aeromonadales bacterium]|nr:DUF3160 domain-containing protein [Aeromonadales bacterium]
MIQRLIKHSTAIIFCVMLGSGSAFAQDNAEDKAQAPEFFSGVFKLYEANREKNIGNYITPDLAVVSYALVKNNLLKQQEQNVLAPEFKALIQGLYGQLNADKNSDPTTLANKDFLSIVLMLIAPESKITLSELAQKELNLIKEAKGLANSPLWQYELDYSQMKVRGHYSQTATLGQYFQSMRYANTVLMPFVVSQATKITPELQERFIAQAQQLNELLHSDAALLKKYQQLNQQLDWSVGPKEDFDMLSFQQAKESCHKLESGTAKKNPLSNCLVTYAKKQGLVPKILGQSIDVSQLKKNEKPEELLIGFRLFPSRYTIDLDLMQNSVYQRPGMLTFEGKTTGRDKLLPFSLSIINGEAVKGYPMINELMQLAGSTLAKNTLEQQQNTRYKDYSNHVLKNEQVLKNYLKRHDAGSAEWQFMQTVFKTHQADTQLQTLTLMRAFWTWRRYQQQLYAKQSYTPNFKSMPPPESRKIADIQPATALYQALAKLITQHEQQTKEKKWGWLLTDVNKLAQLSKKRETQALSEEEMLYLNELDRRLKGIVKNYDQAIVVDVHTNAADKKVLQEATGNVMATYSSLNKTHLRGARLSQCEFKQPISERLTDEAWREQLKEQESLCSKR